MKSEIRNPKSETNSKLKIQKLSSEVSEIKKILIRVPNWLGDSIMSIPTIVGIKKIFPNSEIWIWTKKGLMDLWKFVPEVNGAIDEVPRKNNFDLGILLTNSFNSALKMYLAKIPERRGYSINFRGLLLTQPVKIKTKCKKTHQIDYFLGIVEDLDVDLRDAIPRINIISEIKEKSKKELINFGWDGKSILIGIHATASFGSAKRWIPERFSKLINELINKYNAYIVIIGSESERNEIEDIIKDCKETNKIINIAGKIDLSGLIGVISLCNLFVANDSGPMHISACVGVPVIAIFGSTDSEHTGPRGDRCVILQKQIKCSPCFRRICNRNLECMKSIEVEDIMSAAHSLIK